MEGVCECRSGRRCYKKYENKLNPAFGFSIVGEIQLPYRLFAGSRGSTRYPTGIVIFSEIKSSPFYLIL